MDKMNTSKYLHSFPISLASSLLVEWFILLNVEALYTCTCISQQSV